MKTKQAYVPCPEPQIPGLRFDVPGRNGGQIVIVSYGGWGREEHDEGSPYMSIEDQPELPGRRAKYYRLVEIEAEALEAVLSRRSFGERGIPTLSEAEASEARPDERPTKRRPHEARGSDASNACLGG